MKPILQSTLTCPHCGHVKTETMPGDCCVFCSHGDVPCPPIQISGKGGCRG